MRRTLVLLAALFLMTAGCGDDGGNADGDGGAVGDGGGNGDGGGGNGDGGVSGDAGPSADAFVPSNCVPASTQCNDCVDNDGDGLIDGFDPHCTGAIDNDESSFETGIPGDNKDIAKQDCFFDGNSGGGQDCAFHVCCILDICPPGLPGPTFDPASCAVDLTQTCIDNCLPLTPPGCDCFGCCTICDGPDCADVLVNPVVAPDCDLDVLDDPTKCPTCTKNDMCNPGNCDLSMCVLCPGQTPEDLPPECTSTMCPGGLDTCLTSADCNTGAYCAAGCCVAIVD